METLSKLTFDELIGDVFRFCDQICPSRYINFRPILVSKLISETVSIFRDFSKRLSNMSPSFNIVITRNYILGTRTGQKKAIR